MSNELVTAIGLEVHVQLQSGVKIFCRCPVVSHGPEIPPNAASCPVCQGHPGVLPAFNWEVAELALICALALHCKPEAYSIFERKHYFYPDIPKNFQITQNERPIAKDGWLAIRDEQGKEFKRVRIRKVHLEEDAAKNIHVERERGGNVTLVDFNRCGAPLLEIVSEPDMTKPEEAMIYLEQLQRLVRWHGLSRANMEAGEMRCDANVSVRPVGVKLEETERWELKNLNSIHFVGKALALAQRAQARVLLRGQKKTSTDALRTQTFGYDDKRNELVLHRSKETADDYFYFNEPDLRDVVIDEGTIESAKEKMGLDLDEQQMQLLKSDLPWDYVKKLTARRFLFDFFCAVCEFFGEPRSTVVKWLMRDLLEVVKKRRATHIPIAAERFAEFVRAAEDGRIVRSQAVEVLEVMWDSREADALDIAERLGLRVHEFADEEIERVVRDLAVEYPEQAHRFADGDRKLMNFFMGQAIEKLGKKGDVRKISETIMRVLNEKIE